MDKSHSEIQIALKTAPAACKGAVRQFLSFEKGVIDWAELLHGFFQHVDADNVATIAEILGDRILYFKDLLALGPRLYDEWNQHAGTVVCRTNRGENETEEECQERISKEAKQWRARQERGLEALRAYYRATDLNFAG